MRWAYFSWQMQPQPRLLPLPRDDRLEQQPTGRALQGVRPLAVLGGRHRRRPGAHGARSPAEVGSNSACSLWHVTVCTYKCMTCCHARIDAWQKCHAGTGAWPKWHTFGCLHVILMGLKTCDILSCLCTFMTFLSHSMHCIFVTRLSMHDIFVMRLCVHECFG